MSFEINPVWIAVIAFVTFVVWKYGGEFAGWLSARKANKASKDLAEGAAVLEKAVDDAKSVADSLAADHDGDMDDLNQPPPDFDDAALKELAERGNKAREEHDAWLKENGGGSWVK